MTDPYEVFNVRVTDNDVEWMENRLSRFCGDVDDEWNDGCLAGATLVLEALGFGLERADGSVKVFPPGYDRDCVSVREAAESIGVTVMRVRQLLNEDPPRLAGYKVGKAWLVNRDSVESYRESHRERRA